MEEINIDAPIYVLENVWCFQEVETTKCKD